MNSLSRVALIVGSAVLGGLLASQLPSLSDYRLDTAAGTFTTVKSTDSGGVHTPHVQTQGVYNVTPPSPTDLDKVELQVGARGSLRTEVWGAGGTTNAAVTAAQADGVGNAATTSAGLVVSSRNTMYNGSTWDRMFTCANTASISVTAAATTQIVALASTQIIRVCNFMVAISATGSFKFVQGTGSNCATGQADIHAAMPIAANAPFSSAAGVGSLFRTSASNALCLTAVTGNVTGMVSYAQY